MKASSSAKTLGSPTEQVKAYLAELPPESRRSLTRIREAIRAAAPRAVDAFSYRIPAYRLDGKPLVWYAAFTHHCSLYPMTESIRRANAAALEGYEMSKGTVRFPLDQPVPTALIKRLVRARVAELKQKPKRKP
ncbi:MAG TPA: DUF1801 domain-containing protein [Gemmatimonadaceae bacterium]|nr:DUF1801 domain-containing protein [Gemmatimonadaceae bacterium]